MFLRHPRPGFHSIETVFTTVCDALPERIAPIFVISSHPSCGLANRLLSAFTAAKAVRCNALHIAHMLGDEHFLVLALPWRRTVLTIHDCDALVTVSGLRGAVLRFFWLHLPVRLSAAITTVSERSKAQLIEMTGCNPQKVRVIDNPLPKQYRLAPQPLKRKPRILHIGTKSNKNLNRLIEAIAELDVQLTVIGRLADAHVELLRATRLSWENLVDISDAELLQAYQDCTLLAFVSTSEGFGMPIIEAQAVGRPVLTSDISPMREIAGGAALLVDPHSIAAIRAGIVRLLADAELRAQLIEAGQRNVERFSANVIARRYAELYDEIARFSTGCLRSPRDVPRENRVFYGILLILCRTRKLLNGRPVRSFKAASCERVVLPALKIVERSLACILASAQHVIWISKRKQHG